MKTHCPHCSVEIMIFPEHAEEDYLQCEECEGFFEIHSIHPVALEKLFIEECEECFEDIFIPDEAKIRDIVECSECKKTYEILRKEPEIKLIAHPLFMES